MDTPPIKKRNPLPYDPNMVRKIDMMLDRLEKLEPPSEKPNELPGMFLEKVKVRLLHPNSAQYKEAHWDYHRTRPRFLAGLTQHPVTRSMALLAVGPEGVAQMECGKVPTVPGATITDSKGRTKQQIDFYNCHHVIQKSVTSLDDQHAVNDPYNMVVTQSFASNGSKQNPHNFWHAVYLNPQIKGPTGSEIDFYAPRPAFPFYPPIREGYKNAESIREKLNQLEPNAQLPEKWEQRLVAFSKATNHQPYEVAPEHRQVTQMLVDSFNTKALGSNAKRLKHRQELSQLSAELATERLPAKAWINGTQLSEMHQPSIKISLLDSTTMATNTAIQSLPKPQLTHTQSNSKTQTQTQL